MKVFYLLITTTFLLFSQAITENLEYQKISGVGYSWQHVNFSNNYSDAIVVCSNVLPSSASNEAVVRVNNIGSSGFDVKIQQPNDTDAGYTTDVYCIISDEGSYTVPIKYEAHKSISSGTSGHKVTNNWKAVNTQEVSSSIVNTYTQPAVLGQVMSFNDSDFSVFWSFNCDDKKNRPFQSGMSDGICIGKHIGQINEAREDEMLGYIVAEAGIYEFEDFSMAVNYGSDSVAGVGSSPAYTYVLDKSYTHGVVTQEAMDGGNGGWAVLYGADPFGTSLDLAIDEETVAFDTSRKHTTEEVAYWVILHDPIADIKLDKNSLAIYDPINLENNPKAIPGAMVKYIINATNEGLGSTDLNSIVIADSIPSNMKLCVSTIEKCKERVFNDGTVSSELSLATVLYSNNNGSDFTYTPISDIEGFDVDVTNIKINLEGSFKESDGIDHPSFNIELYMGVQ